MLGALALDCSKIVMNKSTSSIPYLADNSNDQGEIIYSLPVCLLFANFLVKVTFLVNDTDVVLVHVFPGKSKWISLVDYHSNNIGSSYDEVDFADIMFHYIVTQ